MSSLWSLSQRERKLIISFQFKSRQTHWGQAFILNTVTSQLYEMEKQEERKMQMEKRGKSTWTEHASSRGTGNATIMELPVKSKWITLKKYIKLLIEAGFMNRAALMDISPKKREELMQKYDSQHLSEISNYPSNSPFSTLPSVHRSIHPSIHQFI